MEWIILILLVLAFPGIVVALLRGAIAVARALVILILIALGVAAVWLVVQ